MQEDLAKVLILEDLPTDVELVKRQVRKMSPNSLFAVARNREEFMDKISWFEPDIVLADYRLPDTNGLEALLHVRQHHPNVPFIFVTGTLNNEEKVAETVLHGASGYIIKDNLKSLPDKLHEVWQEHIEAKKERETRLRRQRDNQLILQKAQALLSRMVGNECEEVANLLREVEGNL